MHEDPITKSKRVTNSGGAVVSTIETDPWGADTNRSSSAAFQPRKFTSYDRDQNGTDEAMFRRYNRWQSRFDQPDPYDGSYDFGDPQSFNRYAYVQNDPVNFTDPSGLDAFSEGIAMAQNALQGSFCRSFFGNTDPLKLLSTYLSNGLITVGSSFPVNQGRTIGRQRFISGNTGAATSFAAGSTFNASGGRVTAHPITINRNGFFFSGRTDSRVEVNTIRGSGFEGLNLAQIRGAVIIHELLHVAGRIPSDLTNQRQNSANSQLVRLACFSSLNNPNAPLSTPTTLPNNSLPLRPLIDRIGFGDGGYPWWWYSMWEFTEWVDSIPIGGGYGGPNDPEGPWTGRPKRPPVLR